MSVLRYCCFRWLVYDRALVFEPSRPLACIMMLVWLSSFQRNILVSVYVLKKDDIFIDWSSWSVVGSIILSKLWFECGLSSNQVRTNDVRNVVLLVVDPSSIHHYIFWSDQYYHIVHITVEVQWYGNSDELLLSPSATLCLLHDLYWTSS